MSDSIVALSTPLGKGAIAVIRMSGDNSIDIASKLFCPMPNIPNTLQVGQFDAGVFIDQAMCVFFVAPRSYTGEDMVEIHCHGGIAVVDGIINAIISKGARMAYNGEFSKRAFVNGKQNLTNAEGIIEMIEADTATQARAASNLMNNTLGRKVIDMQDRLCDVISSCEVALDYPEEDLELPTTDVVAEQLQAMIDDIDILLSTVKAGRIIKYGIDIAIVGSPNVGKSSLLNSLIQYDRAIVSSVAGTTRDTVSESIVYKDIKFNFVDTAGIHETDDEIEQMGIKRTIDAIDNADVVLYVVDNPQDVATLQCNSPVIKIFNKCDTYVQSPVLQERSLATSAIYGTSIEELKEQIYDMFAVGEVNANDTVLTNSRHIDCLQTARQLLWNATNECQTNTTLDCVVTVLRDAWENLGQLTGSIATEDIINRIYSKFCLGK